MSQRYVKKTCLLFGEGRRELPFFKILEYSDKFKSKFNKDWRITTDHAQGESCRVILSKCINATKQIDFDLILCFIDTDKLLSDFRISSKRQKEQKDLETIAKDHNIKIIWQQDNHEAELERATKGKIYGKVNMKSRLDRHKQKIINSDFVKNIFKHFEEFN